MELYNSNLVELRKTEVQLEIKNGATLLAHFEVQVVLVDHIRLDQGNDQLCLRLIEAVTNGT